MGKAKKAGGNTYIFNVGNGNQINGQNGMQGRGGCGQCGQKTPIQRLAKMLLNALNGSGGCGQPGGGGGCCSGANPGFGGGFGNVFNTAPSFNLNMRGFLG